LRVWNQIDNPRIIVNRAQIVVMYPWSFSQPRVDGITIAGTEAKNVMKMRTALPIAAIVLLAIPLMTLHLEDLPFAGHIKSSRFRETVSTVISSLLLDSIIKAKMINMPPATTNRMSIPMNDRRI
jgi:hypothetical protein